MPRLTFELDDTCVWGTRALFAVSAAAAPTYGHTSHKSLYLYLALLPAYSPTAPNKHHANQPQADSFVSYMLLTGTPGVTSIKFADFKKIMGGYMHKKAGGHAEL